MNTILKVAAGFTAAIVLMAHAIAADQPAQPASGSSPGVVTKVEKAVVKGAKATANGIERGAKAAGRGIERGAKATERAAKRVAAKVGGKPASAPAAGQ